MPDPPSLSRGCDVKTMAIRMGFLNDVVTATTPATRQYHQEHEMN